MGRVALSQNSKRFVVAGLLDKTMAREISARGIPRDEVLFREEGLRTSVVAGSKVNLG